MNISGAEIIRDSLTQTYHVVLYDKDQLKQFHKHLDFPQLITLLCNSFNMQHINELSFVESLRKFLNSPDMTPVDKEFFMGLPLRDFLALMQTTLEQVTTRDSSQQWGFAKADLLKAPGKVTCPICHKSKLQLVEGMISCPACSLALGDIDDLPDIVTDTSLQTGKEEAVSE